GRGGGGRAHGPDGALGGALLPPMPFPGPVDRPDTARCHRARADPRRLPYGGADAAPAARRRRRGSAGLPGVPSAAPDLQHCRGDVRRHRLLRAAEAAVRPGARGERNHVGPGHVAGTGEGTRDRAALTDVPSVASRFVSRETILAALTT